MKYSSFHKLRWLPVSLVTVFMVVMLTSGSVSAIEKPGEMTNDLVGITPHIGTKVDLSLPFTDSSGTSGALSSFISPGKPAIIVPVYYDCPRLCGLLTKGVFDALAEVSLKLGKEYSLIFISIDSTENFELAAKRKLSRIEMLQSRGIGGDQFHYLVGEKDPVQAVMTSLGFNYKPDGEKDFAHTAALMILSPMGEITHYFLGIEFVPSDIRLALVEASQGKVGTFIDHVLLYCFRFDPTKGKYTWVAINMVKLGGVVTLIALGTLMGTLWFRYHT